MDKRTISAYENDKIDIKISVLREIALIIGTTVRYLIDGDDEFGDVDAIQMVILLERMTPEMRKVAVEQVRVLASMRV